MNKSTLVRSSIALVAGGIALGFSSAVQARKADAKAVNFGEFDRRARNGEQLNIVFFGGSLTWGANATDPQETSYRALIGKRLRAHYPRAHFYFRDAAIGGTGSQLGVFRLDRDVLPYQPDLVFLDFTINDWSDPVQAERLTSYEAIVRRLSERNVLVMQVVLAVKRSIVPNFDTSATPAAIAALAQKHQEIARAYGVPSADTVAGMRCLFAADPSLPEKWWMPNDPTHPVDSGYAVHAEFIWQSYLDAVRMRAAIKAPPQMLYAPTYRSVQRMRLASTRVLPHGWRRDKPNRISSWYDALMSRWLDDVIVAEGLAESPQNPAPFEIKFRGSSVLLFGEATLKSGKYRVLIDGKPSKLSSGKEVGVFDASARDFGGNMHHVRPLAQGLDVTVEHTLEIQPLLETGQELRIESLCIAG